MKNAIKLLNYALDSSYINLATELVLKKDSFNSFDCQIFPNLEKLTFENISFQNISKSLEKGSTTIRELCIFNQDNRSVPITELKASFEILSSLKNLSKLTISGFNLKNLIPEIKLLKNLKYLSLRNNHIKSLPNEINELTNLVIFNLSDNQIKELPDEIGELYNLKEFYLNRNKLKKLCYGVALLQNLQTLELNENLFKSIPLEISLLSNLYHLRIDQNKISSLTCSSLDLRDFRDNFNSSDLVLNINQFLELNFELYESLKINGFGQKGILDHDLVDIASKKMDIYHKISCIELLQRSNKLVFSTFSNLKNLTVLNLKGKKITEIPEEIEKLPNLLELDLSNNLISEIPKEIGKLGNLRILRLEKNKIATISNEIGNLARLEILDLSKNKILEIPEPITKMIKLRILNLKSNKISCISGDAGHLDFRSANLRRLQDLNLSKNKIKIVVGIQQLTSLQFLDLSRNEISDFPIENTNLRFSKDLKFSDKNFNFLKN